MLTILQGDARKILLTLPDGLFQTIVTSPPYWNQRDYGTATWIGGEDPKCDHKRNHNCDPLHGPKLQGAAQNGGSGKPGRIARDQCHRCGATRKDAQMGLEKTPEAYVRRMVRIFREAKRVLRDDGTVWLNLGDSYSSLAGGYDIAGSRGASSHKRISKGTMAANVGKERRPPKGLKPKDLVGIPWRLALALQRDGWYLRSDIIWHKPNPMPESVRDRPTKSHEHIFLLSKSEDYYYDRQAIAEPVTGNSHPRGKVLPGQGPVLIDCPQDRPHKGRIWGRLDDTRNTRTVWTAEEEEWEQFQRWKLERALDDRDVWHIDTYAYKGDHFAAFPPKLARRCILAGSRPGDHVLDFFAGSGTTAMVALEEKRNATAVELSEAYITQIKARCHTTPGMGI